MWIISLPYAVADDSINIRYKLFIYSQGVHISGCGFVMVCKEAR